MTARTKLLTIAALVCLNIQDINAQQDPQFTQYYFNPLSINSGYAGTRDALSLNLLAREQWLGLEGRPRTQSLSIHSPLSESNISLGGSVTSDKHGPIRSTYLNLDGAYSFQVNDKSKLSLGIRSSLHYFRADLSNLETGGDSSFEADLKSSGMPNFGVSAYWYSKTHFVGLSAPRLIENDFNNSEQSIETPLEKRHFFITGGKVFTLNSRLKLKPTALIKYVPAAPLSIDLSANLLVQEKLWIGGFIRVQDALGMMISYQLNENLRLGYSFDKTTSVLSGINSGSHEIMINYDLTLGKEKTMSPRYF